ncbi:hypothetical protein AB0O39_32555 [Streptomyces anulatus]|uniref:hypothetical protein n=1 Tax=Streptomyces anulatus TaxID=1892 RepID=UPI003428966F
MGAVVGRGWDLAPVVLGGLALLGPFAVRVLWYRRHTRVEFRQYEEGLVAVTAGGREVLYPWQSTAVFTDGWDRFKLSTPEGTVVTLGPADRRPALGGERTPRRPPPSIWRTSTGTSGRAPALARAAPPP